MPIYFASDMHLDEKKPELFQAFFTFLDENQHDMDSLYLLGDLFEYWIGDDDIQPLTHQFINRLSNLHEQGTSCFIQHGNRDFLLGQTFLRQAKATLLADNYPLKMGEQTYVLCHGDLLCTLDIEYQKNRKWLHNPMLQFFLRKLPLAKRKQIADRMRARSHEFFHKQDQSVFEVTDESVHALVDRFNADHVIHGHTHKPFTHSISDNQNRYVLGSWSAEGGVIGKYSEDDGFQLIPFIK